MAEALKPLAKETISIFTYNYKSKRKGDGIAVPLSKEMLFLVLVHIMDKNAGNSDENAGGKHEQNTHFKGQQ